MTVQFVNADTGEVLPDDEVRRIVAPTPAPAKSEGYRMPRGIFWALVIGAILVSNFLGFVTGTMSAEIERESIRADNATMRLQIERDQLRDIGDLRGARP